MEPQKLFMTQTIFNPFRWWGIRHIRFWVKMVRFNIWWESYGKHMGMFPNHRDMEYLDAIWKGEA